ncbi:MAG: CDP-alcohol phosphatidyltransferase family protein [Dermatophilaceae bacterium]
MANGITVVRTLVAVALGVVAITTADMWLLVAGYAVYWIGDMLDGAAARWLDQETRNGAVFDIICDRACTCPLAAAYLVQSPDAALPLGVFLVQFMVLDCMLSLAFLYWPISGPNEFYRVDALVHRLNWSPVAKATNTALVIVLVITGQVLAATIAAVVVLGVKVWSAHRVLRLLRERAS